MVQQHQSQQVTRCRIMLNTRRRASISSKHWETTSESIMSDLPSATFSLCQVTVRRVACSTIVEFSYSA